MTLGQLLEEAGERGLVLEARGDSLAIDGPAAVLAALLPVLTAQKAALLALLRQPVPGSVSATPESRYRCHACWRYFPEAQLTVVQETLGRGFRCARCLAEVPVRNEG